MFASLIQTFGRLGIPAGVSLNARWYKLFVVRDEHGVYAYENLCPHGRGPLEWIEDQFLNLDCDHIQCTQHGAIFRFSDGLCVLGPCVGESLTAAPIKVRDGEIFLTG
jgi:nitrite reductase/ring-hydroxylating ferredoxin subunit